MTWLLALPGRLKGALAAALAGVAVLVASYLAGRRDGRQRASEKAQKDYIDARKKMDAADKPADPAAAREWLRQRQRDRDL